MSIYKVSGRRDYRGHSSGSIFEAVLDEQTEDRAVRRGAITLLERTKPRLQPGSYRLPEAADVAGKETADADQNPDQGEGDLSAQSRD